MEYLRTAEVAARIYQAIENKEAFSLVRMADTEENLLWAAKGILPKAQGMNPHVDPDTYPGLVPRLAEGLTKADLLGVPMSGPHAHKAAFQPLLMGGLKLHGVASHWPDGPMPQLCDALVAYYLVIGGFFWGLLRGKRLLVMNDDPMPVARALREGSYANGVPTYNARVLDACRRSVRIEGPGIDPYVELAAQDANNWDVALVGAGARKMAIIPELAEKTGKVVLDMGKVLARLIDPHPIWEKMAKLYAEEG